MENTNTSFKNKWEKNKLLVFDETLREGSDIQKWILGRNGWKTKKGLTLFLKNKKRILDAGCGNGRVTALLRECSNENDTEVAGIDIVSSTVAKSNLKKYKNIRIYKKNLLNNLAEFSLFDFIYCQEVLHHTLFPEKAFKNLVEILKKGGEIAIYIYKRKAPIREYMDDYIRNKIFSLDYDEAIKVSNQITQLGRVLSKKKVMIDIPKIDILQIKKGRYNLHKFFYNYFMKCFWNEQLSFKENSVINYDWYHPQTCSKHTIGEIRKWFKKADLTIVHENIDDYGITMRGIKK